MCKRIFLFLLILPLCHAAFSQNAVKVGGGVTIGSMTTNQKFDLFEKNIMSFSPYVGLDWLSGRYFYLSSAVGWQRIGGNTSVLTSPEGEWQRFVTVGKHWDFVHLNTTARFQYPLSRLNVYAGAGFYANCLAGSRTERDDFYSTDVDFVAERVNFGELVEVGLTTVQGRMKMDFNVSYQIHNNHVVRCGSTKLYGDVWNVSLALGYLL